MSADAPGAFPAPASGPGSARAPLPAAPGSVVHDRHRGPLRALLRQALRLRQSQIGLALAGLVIAVAALGPLLASRSPTDFVGRPYQGPGKGLAFGADALGRDVLSRFLYGGRWLLLLALLATLLGVVLGVLVGMLAGYLGGVVDELLMRANDVVLALPQLVLALLAITIVGPKKWLLVLVIGVTHAPRVARVIRAASVDVAQRDFVKAVQVMGVRRRRVLLSEILPNVTGPLMVELGLRLTYSIGFVAALSFLGLGIQPPAADWGLMINENRIGLTVQPWPVLLPVLAIGTLTVGTNLLADGFAQASAGVDREVSA
jgi:peptide/nickel transport system permease protein